MSTGYNIRTKFWEDFIGSLLPTNDVNLLLLSVEQEDNGCVCVTYLFEIYVMKAYFVRILGF